jgi:hypothetical protein
MANSSGWEWPSNLPPEAEFDFVDLLQQRNFLRTRQAHANFRLASQQVQSVDLTEGEFQPITSI